MMMKAYLVLISKLVDGLAVFADDVAMKLRVNVQLGEVHSGFLQTTLAIIGQMLAR